MPAWATTVTATSTIVQTSSCPTCTKAFRIIYLASPRTVYDVDYGLDIDGKNLKGKNITNIVGNVYTFGCPYCGSTVQLSNT